MVGLGDFWNANPISVYVKVIARLLLNRCLCFGWVFVMLKSILDEGDKPGPTYNIDESGNQHSTFVTARRDQKKLCIDCPQETNLRLPLQEYNWTKAISNINYFVAFEAKNISIKWLSMRYIPETIYG